MLVNTHCHVFNLQSVFTSQTKDILRVCLEDKGFPSQMAVVVVELLDLYIREGGGLSPLDPVSVQAGNVLESISKLSGRLDPAIVADARKFYAPCRLGTEWGAMQMFSSTLARADMTWPFSPRDMLAFLSEALARNIDLVTDALFAQMGGDDIVVPLMMDITDNHDARQFEAQEWYTKGQCLRYPGRVLPFYAMNPKRDDPEKRLQDVINEGAFVGLKLYPSLGYPVDSPVMRRVLVMCAEAGFPVVQHCMPSGFNRSDADHRLSAPENWENLLNLSELKDLKVCFGHFGGTLPGVVVPQSQNECLAWATTIYRLMTQHGGVYADLSYHADANRTSGYFEALTRLLTNDVTSSRVLWGTDYFLVRACVSDRDYTEYFRHHLANPMLWEQLTLTNPLGFLGLNLADPLRSSTSITKHIEYLCRNYGSLSTNYAADWVKLLLAPGPVQAPVPVGGP